MKIKKIVALVAMGIAGLTMLTAVQLFQTTLFYTKQQTHALQDGMKLRTCVTTGKTLTQRILLVMVESFTMLVKLVMYLGEL